MPKKKPSPQPADSGEGLASEPAVNAILGESHRTDHLRKHLIPMTAYAVQESTSNVPATGETRLVHVLVTGETGVGKELVVSAVTEAAGLKLKSINCAQFSEGLLASELFGHEKGAFTGAVKKKVGILGEIAKHNQEKKETDKAQALFLDELGTMPRPLQAQLLRLMESEEYRQVGSEKTLDCNCVFFAAAREPGEIRDDLLYRFDKPIEVPALRERPSDIFTILQGILKSEHPNAEWWMTPTTFIRTLYWRWPGNVRELGRAARASLKAWHYEKREGDKILFDFCPPDRALENRGVVARLWREMVNIGTTTVPLINKDLSAEWEEFRWPAFSEGRELEAWNSDVEGVYEPDSSNDRDALAHNALTGFSCTKAIEILWKHARHREDVDTPIPIRVDEKWQLGVSHRDESCVRSLFLYELDTNREKYLPFPLPPEERPEESQKGDGSEEPAELSATQVAEMLEEKKGVPLTTGRTRVTTASNSGQLQHKGQKGKRTYTRENALVWIKAQPEYQPRKDESYDDEALIEENLR